MNLSDALAQSPVVRRAQTRSKYLEDALASIQASGEKIQSWGELAAKLAALGITQYSKGKADSSLQEALQGEFQGRQSSLLSQLEGLGGPPSQPAPVAPQAPAPQPGAMGAGAGGLASALGAPPPAPAHGYSPQDLDLVARTAWGEARSEGPQGIQAVANVIFNRARQTGKSPAEIVRERGQFEPWMNPTTRARMEALTPDQLAPIMQAIQPALEGQDVTGGADHFYSPRAQSALGRRPPSWDNGRGVDLGNHRFFSLGYGPGAPTGPNPQAAPQQPPVEFSPETNQALQGLGIGLGGQPSAPGPQPTQEPPPAPSPQGVGGNPQAPQQQPNPLGATAGEMQMIRQLASRPETYDQAQAMVMKIQQRMNAPTQYETTTVNGVPAYYNPANPQGGITPFPIPQAAMSQVVSGQEAGVPGAAQGTAFNRSPTGGVTQAWAPPSGFQAAPGGRQSYIPGSSADPTTGENRMAALRGFRQELAPVLTAATQLQRNYNAVQAGYRQQNGAGDIAIINGIQRLIDEGVVREGDVALQLKAQGINGGIAGLRGFIDSNGMFSPQIRQQLYTTATDIYQTTNATLRDRVLPYRGIVERSYGPGAFADVVPEETQRAMGWIQEPDRAAPQGGQPQARGAAPARPQGQQPAPQAAERPPAGYPANARKSPRDGNWYIPDPNRPGKYIRVSG